MEEEVKQLKETDVVLFKKIKNYEDYEMKKEEEIKQLKEREIMLSKKIENYAEEEMKIKREGRRKNTKPKRKRIGERKIFFTEN